MKDNLTNIAVKIHALLKDKKAFVFYKKPSVSRFCRVINLIVQKNNNLYTTQSFDESGFVFAPFNREEETLFFPATQSESSVYQVPSKNKISFKKRQIDTKKKQKYIELLHKAIAVITIQKAEKIVLSRYVEKNYSKESIGTIYEHLAQSYPEAFVYFWFHPKVGAWMGATPEKLVKINGTNFSTMSLAGTQLHATTIQWEEKEKAEQKIVTTFIKDHLKPLASKLEISKVFTKKAGHLAHICTEIDGELSDDFSVKDLIFSLHPTPAVAGVPRDVATDFIKKNEGYNRNFYTGFLGEINRDSQTELYVNLRCMQLKDGVAKLFVGGGLTKDSIPEKEWEETVEKTAVLGKFLS